MKKFVKATIIDVIVAFLIVILIILLPQIIKLYKF